MRILLLAGLFLLSNFALAQAPCPERLLASDYFADQVYVFSACDGSFLGELDDSGRLDGPQATRLGPDGLLYVVSEENNRIVRYDGDTLEFVDIFIETFRAGVFRPVALDFGPDGDLYVAGFDSANVVRYDSDSGGAVATFVSAGSQGIDEPDAGAGFAPNGDYLVPDFGRGALLRYDGATGAPIGTLLGNGELNSPRVFAFDGPDRVIISSYGRSEIVVAAYPSGEVLSRFDFFNPTGLAFRADGALIAGREGGGQIFTVDTTSGESTPLVARGTTPLGTTVFVTVIPAASEPPAGEPPVASTNDQYWIVGVGQLGEDGLLVVEEMVSASGAVFGEAFDPDNVERPSWGSIQIEFLSCDSARLSWTSDAMAGAGFGTGSYDLQRLAPGPIQSRCEDQGFGSTPDHGWLAGSWYGGEARSGEGLLIDPIGEDQAFVAWFTFGKAEEPAP